MTALIWMLAWLLQVLPGESTLSGEDVLSVSPEPLLTHGGASLEDNTCCCFKELSETWSPDDSHVKSSSTLKVDFKTVDIIAGSPRSLKSIHCQL